MKAFIRLLTIILKSITLITINPLSVRNSDPPSPPGDHGQNGNQPPGGRAPIAGGIGILLALAAAYGGKILYDLKNGIQASVQTMDK